MDSATKPSSTVEQNMRLINVAFDCVFINASEKEKTLKLLEEKSKENPDTNVIEIFKQENFISDKRIEYLLAFDTYLQIHSEDHQFGKIAIANGLASEEDVYSALKHQENYFKNNRMSMLIGDILVGNGSITRADQVSILLTQNRIKDENLSDALNDIGKTQMEKDAVNKRFGVLAIKKELVAIEQVNTALEIQKNERNKPGEPRFIGQILKETADLSDSDILQILLEQKQFEKRRLDLEKALYTVKSELRISKKLNRLFEYSISKDGLEAFVKKRKEIDEAIPIYEFLIWLRRVGIKFGFVDDAVLEKFIQKTEEKSQITVAKGYPAGQCTNETIEFYFENEFSQAQQESNKTDPDQIESSDKEDIAQEKPIEKKQPQELESKDNKPDQEKIPSHKNDDEKDNDPLFFKQGSLLARIIPGKKGKPGKDVLGYPIQPDKPSICILNAGSGVIKKGSVFLARIDGRPVLKNGVTLMVETALQKNEIKTIPGNISNDTKDTYDAATLEVSGIITTEGILRCRSLLLLGNMMGCVICSGDIDIKGNIGTDKETKDKGTLHQADILCQGSVKASKSIMNSKIQTEGELLAFGSTVIGSQVLAFKGMRIKDSLKGVNGPSILQFGIKPGDKSIPLDHTIETKNAELSVLKKETEIAQLTETYNKELKEAENHQLEQTIFKNLVEIIEAPDLYQYNGLEGKIKYLYSLPDFSSVKAYYLKLPETDTALAVLNQIIASTKTMPLENALKQFKDKIDPEPEDQNAASTISRIETDFKARLAAFKREAAEKSEEIEKIENDIKGLQALRAKLGSRHVNSLSPSTSAIKIKNKCEKGTIIKGVFAQLVVEKTLYNVEFKEVIDPTTNTGSIVIETY